MRLRVVALTVGCLAAASLALGQAPPLSGELQVNTETTNDQYITDVAMDATGNFVVVWESYQNGTAADVYARRYDSNGNALGADFRVNTYTTAYQGYPAVASTPAGAFTVVWGSFEQNESLGSDIHGQRYDSAGNPAGGEFLVNTYTTGYQYFPAIAANADGNFAVVWVSSPQDGDLSGIYGKTFDASGTPLGAEFRVNQFTTGYQWLPRVAAGGNGDFVVVWQSQGQDGDGYAVMARRFAPDGTPRDNEFQVNQATTGDQQRAAVAADEAGDFVVTWSSLGQDGSAEGVFARRFGNAGQPLGDEFLVNTYTTGSQTWPRVAMDVKGNFIVAWQSDAEDGSDLGAYAQRFDKTGAPVGGEFQVNINTTYAQELPAVALGANGRTVITWDSENATDFDVFARMTAPVPKFLAADAQFAAPSPGAPQSAPLNGVFEPGETVTVVPTWVNDTPDPLPLTGTASNFTGPSGANYTLQSASADYGTIPSGSLANCILPNSCYSMQVDDPAVRPAAHWDSTFDETLSSGGIKTWTLHIGESFADAPSDNLFYSYIENLFHNGVTGGCAGGGYCPTNPVTRAQMAVFLLKAKYSSAHVPPPCTGTVFADVPCTGGPFDPWIEELAGLQITGGCGGGNYCPGATVTRQQMAVFLLKAFEGSSYDPPDCTGVFDDVPCTPGTGFSDWIEELASRGITGGCSAAPPLYCPTNPNNRGQMAVFLVKTFGLTIYGP